MQSLGKGLALRVGSSTTGNVTAGRDFGFIAVYVLMCFFISRSWLKQDGVTVECTCIEL